MDVKLPLILSSIKVVFRAAWGSWKLFYFIEFGLMYFEYRTTVRTL